MPFTGLCLMPISDEHQKRKCQRGERRGEERRERGRKERRGKEREERKGERIKKSLHLLLILLNAKQSSLYGKVTYTQIVHGSPQSATQG